MKEPSAKPLITVVMPVYNCALFIKEAVESILNQTEKNFELLILDDCSTDGTLPEIEKIIDNRINVLKSETNRGQAFQLNKGIQLARGEYIAIAHGDDINYPERFALQLQVLTQRANIGVVGCWVKYIGEKKGLWHTPTGPDDCFATMFMESPLPHPAVMIRKSVLHQLPVWYIQEFVPAEDYELWVKLSPFCNFYNIPAVLLDYRIHKQQISFLKEGELNDKLSTIRKEFLSLNFPGVYAKNFQVIEEIWNTYSNTTITKSFIRGARNLAALLAADKSKKIKGWNKYIGKWVFTKLISSKNYEQGAGLYFFLLNPFYLFKIKFSDTARIIIRSF